MQQCDVLIVGARFYGSTVAERMAAAGQHVLLVDRRPHIGGNMRYNHLQLAHVTGL